MPETEDKLRARALLEKAKTAESRADRSALALALADVLGHRVHALETRDERRARRRAAQRLSSPRGVELAVAIADRFGRSRDPARRVASVVEVAEHLAPLDFLRPGERATFEAMRRMPKRLRPAAARAIERAIEREFRPYLVTLVGAKARVEAIRRDGAEPIAHLLGEDVVGERMAEARAELEASLYERLGVRHLALKVSSITSRIDPMGLDAALERTLPRAARIAEAAARCGGSLVLDAESSDDLELTLRLLEALAADPRFADVDLGFALQAYLVDARAITDRLLAIGHARYERKARPLRVRLVKGANLGLERIRASLRGHPSAVHADKDATDRAAQALLELLASKEHTHAVHVALGSHNLFDVAHALVHRAAEALDDALSFEVLAGLADPLVRALRALDVDVRVYLPVVDPEERNAAVAYLARRLDEQSAPAHFLPSSLAADRARDPYAEHRARYLRITSEAPLPPPRLEPRRARRLDRPFSNEPDVDLRVPAQRAKLAQALALETARAVFDVKGSHPPAAVEDGFDPSRPGHVPYRVGLADEDGVRLVIERAHAALRSLTRESAEARATRLLAVADTLRANRTSLTAAIVLDVGKPPAEADAEVSEAIDFAEYYARALLDLTRDPTLRNEPRGVVLVASPWNFPLSIACGGVCAALAAGNTVVLKPAPEAPYVGRKLAEALWSAGFDPLVQLLLARDEAASIAIDPALVDAVVLTGSTATARAFRKRAPSLHLIAETGGKNAIFVSATADREAAIRDVVRSAFSFAGQKCSAASLLLLEREVYEDDAFRERLLDAAASLPVKAAWDEDAEITPLIRPPEGPLREALLGTPEGAIPWLRAEPTENPRLFGPAIYGDVEPGSLLHTTELFGPVLAVMPARDVDEACAIAAQTGYALTAGIESLSEDEQAHFARHVRAGNVYVNRPITGARVGRQPFGGFGLSSFGPGAKAGGPGFVESLAVLGDDPAFSFARGTHVDPTPEAVAFLETIRARRVTTPERWLALLRIARLDAHHAESHFSAKETMPLLGEADVLEHEPISDLAIAVFDGAPRADVLRAVLARLATHPHAIVFGALELAELGLHGLDVLPGRALDVAIDERRFERIRVVGEAPAELLALAAERDVELVREPVLRSPRGELRHYVRARSIAVTTHRHGVLPRSGAFAQSTGASKSTSNPIGTMPEGLMVGWLR